MFVGIILNPYVVSFVERFVILCPYFGESTIGGPTVNVYHVLITLHTFNINYTSEV